MSRKPMRRTKAPRRFASGLSAWQRTHMTKKPAIIKGASAGVGIAAAQQLLTLGWRVIGGGCDAGRCAAALDDEAEQMLWAVSAAMTADY